MEGVIWLILEGEFRERNQKVFENGKQVFSCWGQNNKGICVVKKSKQNEWKQRLNVLETQITYWIQPNNSTNKTIEIIQLFYDV